MNSFVSFSLRPVSRAPVFLVYTFAVASVVLGTLLALSLRPFSYSVPFLFFLPAVFFAYAYGGLRPALLATLLSAAASYRYLLLPHFGTAIPGRAALTVLTFFAVMSLAALIVERQDARTRAMIAMQWQLVHNVSEPILIRDRAGRIAFWNQGAERLYGWTNEEACGRTPRELLKTEYPGTPEAIEEECRKNGHWSGRLTRTTKNGSVLEIESSWSLYVDRRLGEYILQADRDVTEINRYLHELRTSNRTLRALSATNRALVRATTETEFLQDVVDVIVTEGGYRVAWVALPEEDGSVQLPAVSEGAKTYLAGAEVNWKTGTQPSAVVLRTGEICLVPDALSHESLSFRREAMIAAGMRGGVCLPLKLHSEVIGALNISSHLPGAFLDSEIKLFTEIAEDLAYGLSVLRAKRVAEEVASEQASLQAQLRQSQRMEAVGQLAGGIAHDFNNLLMIIMSQAELLFDSDLSPLSASRAVSVMQSAKRAADLTRQLLAFSRKQVLQPTSLSVNDVVKNVSSMFERLLGEDINFQTFFARDLWPVQVDRSQLEQVLMNLAVNARDAMPEGGSLTVETANVELGPDYIAVHPVVHAGDYVMIAISDTGCGMEPEIKERIFEPFFTTKPEGKGTGLGLSTVYGIVKQSGGFIWVYSEPGTGTSFKIYLPRASVMETAPAGTNEQPSPVTRAATILVVEDDNDLRKLLAEFLSGKGYEILYADSVESATQVALANRDRIDLLLADVILKGGNGRALAKTLAENGCKCRVIFMSGYTPDSIVHHGVLEEGMHFLQKPFSRSVLLSKIAEVLK